MSEPINVTFNDVLALPTVPPDRIFSYGRLPLQNGEVYLPEKTGAVPLVMLIHGGCWLNQYGLDHIRPLATALNQRGMAVWSIEYRRIGDEGGGYPGTFEDIKQAAAALSELKSELRSQGYLPSETITIGHSAGGHLALWVAAETRIFDRVVGLAAITDLKAYAAGQSSCQQAAKTLMGPNASMEDYFSVSPVRLQYGRSKICLLAGSSDNIVGRDQITAFQQSHPTASVSILASTGHFDFIHPQTKAVQALFKSVCDD